MKKKKLLFLFISLMILGVNQANASSNEEFFKVDSENALVECFSKDNICELTSNITLSAGHTISNKVILDLKGFYIEPDSSLKLHSGMLVVGRGGKLTVIDTRGNGKISTGPSENVWVAIQVADNKDDSQPAELVVNNGTIEGYYYGITGNGNNNNTIVTINGGTIKGLNTNDSAGIFQPQMGTMVINNGTITGGTGIEIRSGDLTINGGTIKGIAEKFVKVINKSGTTTNGVGVAVAQHTTKHDINVTINNGNISGIYGFYEWNPHNNDEIDKVKIRINNGNIKTIADDGRAVYSEDFTNFIYDGDFNTDVSKYLVNNSSSTTIKVEETPKIIEEKSYTSLYLTIGVIMCLTLGIIVYYKKLKKN